MQRVLCNDADSLTGNYSSPIPPIFPSDATGASSESRREPSTGRSRYIQSRKFNEWLLDKPGDDTRAMLLELFERRAGTCSTIFCTQYKQKDWHARLGGGVHADAIMDRIVHNAVWLETGDLNMREVIGRESMRSLGV